MPRSSPTTGWCGTPFPTTYKDFVEFLHRTIDQDLTSTTPAQPTGRENMEESKSTSTASAPSGSTSTVDQENLMRLHSKLMDQLFSFAVKWCCPHPWSWAAEWASTCIGPSWKNWDMPSGGLTPTGSKPYACCTGCGRMVAELPTPPASSAPPALTGEKMAETSSSSAALSDSYRRQILDAYWNAPLRARVDALKEIRHRDAWNWGRAAPAETPPPASSTTTPTPPLDGSVKSAYRFKPSTVLEISASLDGTLLVEWRRGL